MNACHIVYRLADSATHKHSNWGYISSTDKVIQSQLMIKDQLKFSLQVGTLQDIAACLSNDEVCERATPRCNGV